MTETGTSLLLDLLRHTERLAVSGFRDAGEHVAYHLLKPLRQLCAHACTHEASLPQKTLQQREFLSGVPHPHDFHREQ